MAEKFYNVIELAERFGVSRQTISRKIKSGIISGVKFGKNYRITEKEVKRLEKEGF